MGIYINKGNKGFQSARNSEYYWSNTNAYDAVADYLNMNTMRG